MPAHVHAPRNASEPQVSDTLPPLPDLELPALDRAGPRQGWLSRQRLGRLVVVVGLVLVLQVLALIAWAAWREWALTAQVQAGRQSLQAFDLGLQVAEQASRERGPSNALLGGATDVPDPAAVERLRLARERTDRAFLALQQQLVFRPQSPQGDVRLAIDDAARALAQARVQVDRTTALPLAQRTPALIRQAVGTMIDVIPRLQFPLTELQHEAQGADPRLGDVLAGARLAADLREYAGQLGSQFTAPLTSRQPFTAEERSHIEQIRGRIAGLRTLLEQHLGAVATPGDARLLQARQAMEAGYFDRSEQLINAVLQAGSGQTPYPVDAAGFAARYVPQMDGIVAVRDALVEGGRVRADATLVQARHTLLVLLAASALVVLTLLLVVWVLRSRVLRPLITTRDVIVALASGQLGRSIPAANAQDEIGDVLGALVVLKRNSQVREALERERETLIGALREQSTTDFLTELPNRRHFFEAAERERANAARHRRPFAVLMIDLDHFKKINDTYGHAAGDLCLQAVALRVRQCVRQGDLIARLGGEEFAILLPACGAEQALAHAERLRSQLSHAPVRIDELTTVRITASIGVAAHEQGDESLERLLQRADAAMFAAKRAGRDRVWLASATQVVADSTF